jgi:hypothetical protein
MSGGSTGRISDEERRAARMRIAQDYINNNPAQPQVSTPSSPSANPSSTGITGSVTLAALSSLGSPSSSGDSLRFRGLTGDQDAAPTSADPSPIRDVGSFIDDNLESVSQDMLEFAGRQKNREKRKKDVKVDKASLEDLLANWPKTGGADNASAQVELHVWDPTTKTYKVETQTLTKAQAESRLADLKEESSQLDSMGQEEYLELQKLMQDYQLLMQLYTNMLRIQYDIGKNIVGNIHS